MLFIWKGVINVVYKYTIMCEFERRHLETELKKFTARNFVHPSECRNLDQIRFYISELCVKIEDYKRRFDYVPKTAYSLLSQYNSRQNSLLYRDFISNY